MEFLTENWFAIIAVILIVFLGFKGNKILGGNVRGGCCGSSYVPERQNEESKEIHKK